MNVRRWISPALLLLGLACLTVTGFGQNVQLKVFSGKDKSFYQTVETKTDQELKVGDMTFKQKQTQTFLMKWTSNGEKDGKITIVQEIVGVKMDLDIGGNKISYDTEAKDTPKNPMTQFFKTLEKAKFTLTVDPSTYKVEKVEGVNNLVDELVKVNQAFKPVIQQILSEDTIKTLAEPIFGMLPPKGNLPDKGKSWNGSELVMKMGQLGTYTSKSKYTYEGQEKDKLEKIKVEPDLTYKKPEESKEKGNLPFVIEDGTLTTKEANGTIFFDKDAGRVANSKLHVVLKGELKVTIAATKATVNLNQTQDVTVQSFDDNPWKKAPPK